MEEESGGSGEEGEGGRWGSEHPGIYSRREWPRDSAGWCDAIGAGGEEGGWWAAGIRFVSGAEGNGGSEERLGTRDWEREWAVG